MRRKPQLGAEPRREEKTKTKNCWVRRFQKVSVGSEVSKSFGALAPNLFGTVSPSHKARLTKSILNSNKKEKRG